MNTKILNYICKKIENSVNEKEERYLIIDLQKMSKMEDNNEIKCEIRQQINDNEIIYVNPSDFILDFTNRNLKNRLHERILYKVANFIAKKLQRFVYDYSKEFVILNLNKLNKNENEKYFVKIFNKKTKKESKTMDFHDFICLEIEENQL